jgi:hypothetical protein
VLDEQTRTGAFNPTHSKTIEWRLPSSFQYRVLWKAVLRTRGLLLRHRKNSPEGDGLVPGQLPAILAGCGDEVSFFPLAAYRGAEAVSVALSEPALLHGEEALSSLRDLSNGAQGFHRRWLGQSNRLGLILGACGFAANPRGGGLAWKPKRQRFSSITLQCCIRTRGHY